ncbi:hypothetical protein PAAG_06824 [Paracoccidioides lutzii Pb01]|uniref:Uncharacterized protein n=1 Tax=Paracoccidioides lutzii (strain ATCC MYA-826 / Pb01) TaxID=502779 RepID=C1H7T3_PARBA|nr:hypothetical protein PAAG_06824 [Paracoccidioides lutzii Pb01]EEH36406.2 hypothetical protein PAAG_06824 [Paracoccidioides lutzii Pb01]
MDDNMAYPPTTYDTPGGRIDLTSGYEQYRAVFPPQVDAVQVLGNLSDPAKGHHARNGGFSAILADHPYFMFGPIESEGYDKTPFGIISNAAARALEPREDPLLTTYYAIEPNGYTPPLLGLTENEVKFEHETGLEVIISTDGGLAEGRPGSGNGCVWFQKTIREKRDGLPPRNFYHGTGVAPVKVDITGKLLGRRVLGDTVIFKEHEPAFGTFCAINHQGWYYLWGRHINDIYLARVHVEHAFEREYYQFWNGYSFTGDIGMVTPVLSGFTHGVIYPTRLFGHTFGWAFIGNTAWDDYTAMMGAAKDPQGPFQVVPVAFGEKLQENAFNECIYAHPWAFKESLGEILITWSEKWPGGIIAAKFQMQMLHQGAYWTDISLEELQTSISTLAKTHGVLEEIADDHGVLYELESKSFGKAGIKLLGSSAEAVDAAAIAICQRLEVWVRQAMGITEEEKEKEKRTFKNGFGLFSRSKNRDRK